eukprot:1010021-Rhodomonas_salina.2
MRGTGMAWSSPLSVYARATQCPVLTQGMVLQLEQCKCLAHLDLGCRPTPLLRDVWYNNIGSDGARILAKVNSAICLRVC